MRLVQSFLWVCAILTGAAAPPALAQPVPAGPADLSVSNLTLNGEFNPGGRVQFGVTVNATGKFPKADRQLTYAFQVCREQSSATCTGVATGVVKYTPGSVTKIVADWKRITPWLPAGGTPPTRIMVFVKDQALQEDFANNEQWSPVSVGTLPRAPYAYQKFDDREIDKHNSAKLSKVSRDACLLACSADSLCKSVDYAPKTKTCYLQHVHRKDVGGAYIKSSKYDHYARPCQLDDSPQKCGT